MERDNGSVLLPVVIIAACIALYTFMVLRTARSDIVVSEAAITHTRMDAAADAGVSTAVASMLQEPDLSGWTNGTRTGQFEIGELRVSYLVADLRGRVPLNNITVEQAERLFSLGGAGPAESSTMADELVARRSSEDDANNARSDEIDLLPLSRTDVHSLSDLLTLTGMTKETLTKISPYVTVVTDGFDPTTASSEALSVMNPELSKSASAKNSPNSDQTKSKIFMRPLELSVTVLGDHSQIHKTFQIELTGSPLRPFLERGML